ncbi:Emp24/gp25L/p24 family protein [Cooperia oncophora]
MQTVLSLIVVSFIFIPLCLALIREDEIYLTFEVPSGKTECFYVPILKPEYRALEFSYSVSRGNRDISLTIRDPRDVEVVADERTKHHFHRIVIADSDSSKGDYSVCLDNSFSYDSKAVSISLHLLDAKGDYVRNMSDLKADEQMKITVDVFEASTNRLMTNIDAADRQLVQIRVVSNIDRSIAEQNFERVNWYGTLNTCIILIAAVTQDRSIAEQNFERVNWYGTLNTCIILIAAVTQVLLIRSLLTEDSRVGKLLRHGRK